jgi:hypothetical protein
MIVAKKSGIPIDSDSSRSDAMTSSNQSNAKNPQIRKFIDVQKALKGADYPADKETLLKLAKQNGADEEVMEALAALGGESFESPAAVSKAIGNE